MILGFEGCTPIYNNHATTAFSMVLTPSRLGLPITRLIFVSYAAAAGGGGVVKKCKMFSNPIMIPSSHPSDSPSSANDCNLPRICFLNVQTEAALS